jgi:hypothetical protein
MFVPNVNVLVFKRRHLRLLSLLLRPIVCHCRNLNFPISYGVLVTGEIPALSHCWRNILLHLHIYSKHISFIRIDLPFRYRFEVAYFVEERALPTIAFNQHGMINPVLTSLHNECSEHYWMSDADTRRHRMDVVESCSSTAFFSLP